MIDYVGEGTCNAKFYANPSKGASRQMGEIYAKIFLAVHIPFFQKLTYRSEPCGGFLRAVVQTTRSRARMCFLGVTKFKISI